MSEIHRRPVSSAPEMASYAHGPRTSRKNRDPRPGLSSPSRGVRQTGLWGAPAFAPGPRCSEKGCIFPATKSGTGKCLLHGLEESEPVLFLSCQPTMLLLDQAKFGPPDPEADYSRARDRRRLATLREEFLEEVA